MTSKPSIRTLGYEIFLSALATLAVIATVSAVFTSTMAFSAYAQEADSEEADAGERQQQEGPSSPRLKDSTLRVELVADGLDHPTSMDYINDRDMIILQKDGEAVLVSTNGSNQDDDQPVVMDVPVNSDSERGLLGIAVAHSSSANNDDKTYVFLYFTELNEENSLDVRNRVYRYEWNALDKMLVNPVLILDLPATPGPNHDGGKLIVGDKNLGDNYLYAVIGDLNRDGLLQNFKNGQEPDDTSGIFRVTFDGSAPNDNPFSGSNGNGDNGLSKYLAYGIRNSFGLTIDPLTGILWMTENGPDNYDEINVVEPGFNSGWQQVMGPIEKSGKSTDDLVQLSGSHYADPVFSWLESVGITDIEFLDSAKLGSKYANNIFVGDITNGNLYFFTVDETRKGIALEGASGDSTVGGLGDGLVDKTVDNQGELDAITFGTGFNGITDIETGSDGNLYILSFDGLLYRIVPNSQ